jgi:hypothetical protein
MNAQTVRLMSRPPVFGLRHLEGPIPLEVPPADPVEEQPVAWGPAISNATRASLQAGCRETAT